MKRKSVFEYLAGRELTRIGSFYSDQDSEESTLEERADIGDRIMNEFYQRGNKLRQEERDLAIEYFEEGFWKARNNAECYFNLAKQAKNSQEQTDYLRTAGQMIGRAREDISRTKKICPNRTAFSKARFSYTSALDALDVLSERLEIVFEFPDSYEIITDPILKLRVALEHEDYERAAKLKDEIERKREELLSYDQF